MERATSSASLQLLEDLTDEDLFNPKDCPPGRLLQFTDISLQDDPTTRPLFDSAQHHSSEDFDSLRRTSEDVGPLRRVSEDLVSHRSSVEYCAPFRSSRDFGSFRPSEDFSSSEDFLPFRLSEGCPFFRSSEELGPFRSSSGGCGAFHSSKETMPSSCVVHMQESSALRRSNSPRGRHSSSPPHLPLPLLPAACIPRSRVTLVVTSCLAVALTALTLLSFVLS